MNKQRHTKPAFFRVLVIGISILFLAGCQKDLKTINPLDDFESIANAHGHLVQTKNFPSDVAVKWLDMQIRIMRTATGIPNVAFIRPYAYSGIALYEAVVPGMPSYPSLSGKLNGLSGLPDTKPGLAYHWAGSANAALASMNRKCFQQRVMSTKRLWILWKLL